MFTFAGNLAASHAKGSRVVREHVVLLPMLIYDMKRLFLLVMLFSVL